MINLNENLTISTKRLRQLNNQLILASKDGQNAGVRDLIKEGANVNARNNEALIMACIYGHVDVVKTLLKNGANVNAKKDKALFWAATNGYPELVKILLKHGANVNSQFITLTLAAANGYDEVVKTLIIDYQMKVSYRTKQILKEQGSNYALDLITKRDLEKQLQKDVKPIPEKKSSIDKL